MSVSMYKVETEPIKTSDLAIAELLLNVLEPFASGQQTDYFYIQTDYVECIWDNPKLTEDEREAIKEWLYENFTQDELDDGFDLMIGW